MKCQCCHREVFEHKVAQYKTKKVCQRCFYKLRKKLIIIDKNDKFVIEKIIYPFRIRTL